MFNLIRNENLKLYAQVSTKVMLILLIVLTSLFVFINAKSSEDSNEIYTYDEVNDKDIKVPIEEFDWKAQLKEENENLKLMIKDEKGIDSEEYKNDQWYKENLKNMEENVLINEYRIKNDISPYSEYSFWKFMNDNTFTFSLIITFTLIAASSIVSNEFTWGTIKLLLIRPYSRTKILLSKLISIYLFSLVMMVIFFAITLIVGLLFFGTGGYNDVNLFMENGKIIEQPIYLIVLETYLFLFIKLVLITSFAFFVSTVFRSSALAMGISIIILLLGSTIVELLILAKMYWVKYLFIYSMDVSRYDGGLSVIKGTNETYSIVLNAIYFIVFIVLSIIVFKKRDV